MSFAQNDNSLQQDRFEAWPIEQDESSAAWPAASTPHSCCLSPTVPMAAMRPRLDPSMPQPVARAMACDVSYGVSPPSKSAALPSSGGKQTHHTPLVKVEALQPSIPAEVFGCSEPAIKSEHLSLPHALGAMCESADGTSGLEVEPVTAIEAASVQPTVRGIESGSTGQGEKALESMELPRRAEAMDADRDASVECEKSVGGAPTAAVSKPILHASVSSEACVNAPSAEGASASVACRLGASESARSSLLPASDSQAEQPHFATMYSAKGAPRPTRRGDDLIDAKRSRVGQRFQAEPLPSAPGSPTVRGDEFAFNPSVLPIESLQAYLKSVSEAWGHVGVGGSKSPRSRLPGGKYRGKGIKGGAVGWLDGCMLDLALATLHK